MTAMSPAERMRRYRERNADRVRDAESKRRPTRRAYDAGYRRQRRLMRPFVGIDGEGRNLPNGYHAYFMLRAGNQVLWSNSGHSRLRTRDVLEFLCGLDPDAIYVGYFFDYDVTKILEDLPFAKLESLIRRERRIRNKGGYFPVDWGGFQVEYFPRKEFKVRKLVKPHSGKLIDNGDGTKHWEIPAEYSPWIVINDVGSFFQCAFIETLRNWKIGTPEQQDMIAEGKELRGEFAEISNEYIDRYNALECELLSKLMSQFRNVCVELDIVPRKWQGPGQLAEKAMEKYGVPDTKSLELFSDQISDWHAEHLGGMDLSVLRDDGVGDFGRYAYYGGWFETSVVGYTPAPCLQWDVNSAYPTALQHVPCLVHGKWTRAFGKRVLDDDELSICFGTFRHDRSGKSVSFGGFSVRRKDGSVHRPLNGRGWYWSFEVRAAIHQSFTVFDSWIYTRTCDCQPFEFVTGLYRERKALGKNAKGLVLKLVLNSLYGKLVQSIGSPRYSNPVWASFITAWTRTEMAKAIHSLPGCAHPDDRVPCGSDVYMVATDAIVCRDYEGIDAAFEIGDGLGQFSKEVHEDGLFIIQPGVYFNPTGSNDKTLYKTRGVPKRKVIQFRDVFLARFDDMLRLRDVTKGDVHLPFTLFVGIKQALQMKSMKTLGQIKEYVDGQTGEVGRRTSFEWTTKRQPQPIGFGGRRPNGLPRHIRTTPYDGFSDKNGNPAERGYVTQTVPYSKDIGGLMRNEALREEFAGQPDWIATQ